MATDLSICNTAITLVGADQIQAFDDESREAELCSAIYAGTKDALLTSMPWSFTLEQALLAKTANTPLFDYQYEFQLPSNSVRVITVDNLVKDYRIHQDKIFANTSELKILHQIIPVESKFPPYFTRALELKMAELLAAALIMDENMSSMFEAKFVTQIRQARSIDSQSSPNRGPRLSAFPLLNVRGNDG